MFSLADVYNVEPGGAKDPNAVVAGATRFAGKMKSFKAENPLILFSGDAINPSSLSTETKGVHMAPVLNEIGTHVAVAGNHDFGECPTCAPETERAAPPERLVRPDHVAHSLRAPAAPVPQTSAWTTTWRSATPPSSRGC